MLFSSFKKSTYVFIILPTTSLYQLPTKKWLIYLPFPPKYGFIVVQKCLFLFLSFPSQHLLHVVCKQLFNRHLFKNEWKNKCGLSRTQTHWWWSAFLKTTKILHGDMERFTDIPASPVLILFICPSRKALERFQWRTVGYHKQGMVIECAVHSLSMQQTLGAFLHFVSPSP